MAINVGELITLNTGGGIGGLQPIPWDIATSNILPAGAQPGFMYTTSSNGVSTNGVRFSTGDIAIVSNNGVAVENLTNKDSIILTENYATLNPLDKYSLGDMLSNGNLTYTNTSNNISQIASTINITQNCYYEATVDALGFNTIGFIDETALTSPEAITTGEFFLFGRFDQGLVAAYLGAPPAEPAPIMFTNPPADLVVGDILGIRIEYSTRTITCYVNGVELLTASPIIFPNPTSTLKALIYMGGLGASETINFGATPFAYPITGYNGLSSMTSTFSGAFRYISNAWNPNNGFPNPPDLRAGDLYYASTLGTHLGITYTVGTGIWYDGSGWKRLSEAVPLGSMTYLGEVTFDTIAELNGSLDKSTWHSLPYVENGVYKILDNYTIHPNQYSYLSHALHKNTTIIGRNGKWDLLTYNAFPGNWPTNQLTYSGTSIDSIESNTGEKYASRHQSKASKNTIYEFIFGIGQAEFDDFYNMLGLSAAQSGITNYTVNNVTLGFFIPFIDGVSIDASAPAIQDSCKIIIDVYAKEIRKVTEFDSVVVGTWAQDIKKGDIFTAAFVNYNQIRFSLNGQSINTSNTYISSNKLYNETNDAHNVIAPFAYMDVTISDIPNVATLSTDMLKVNTGEIPFTYMPSISTYSTTFNEDQYLEKTIKLEDSLSVGSVKKINSDSKVETPMYPVPIFYQGPGNMFFDGIYYTNTTDELTPSSFGEFNTLVNIHKVGYLSGISAYVPTLGDSVVSGNIQDPYNRRHMIKLKNPEFIDPHATSMGIILAGSDSTARTISKIISRIVDKPFEDNTVYTTPPSGTVGQYIQYDTGSSKHICGPYSNTDGWYHKPKWNMNDYINMNQYGFGYAISPNEKSITNHPDSTIWEQSPALLHDKIKRTHLIGFEGTNTGKTIAFSIDNLSVNQSLVLEILNSDSVHNPVAPSVIKFERHQSGAFSLLLNNTDYYTPPVVAYTPGEQWLLSIGDDIILTNPNGVQFVVDNGVVWSDYINDYSYSMRILTVTAVAFGMTLLDVSTTSLTVPAGYNTDWVSDHPTAFADLNGISHALAIALTPDGYYKTYHATVNGNLLITPTVGVGTVLPTSFGIDWDYVAVQLLAGETVYDVYIDSNNKLINHTTKIYPFVTAYFDQTTNDTVSLLGKSGWTTKPEQLNLQFSGYYYPFNRVTADIVLTQNIDEGSLIVTPAYPVTEYVNGVNINRNKILYDPSGAPVVLPLSTTYGTVEHCHYMNGGNYKIDSPYRSALFTGSGICTIGYSKLHYYESSPGAIFINTYDRRPIGTVYKFVQENLTDTFTVTTDIPDNIEFYYGGTGSTTDKVSSFSTRNQGDILILTLVSQYNSVDVWKIEYIPAIKNDSVFVGSKKYSECYYKETSATTILSIDNGIFTDEFGSLIMNNNGTGSGYVVNKTLPLALFSNKTTKEWRFTFTIDTSSVFTSSYGIFGVGFTESGSLINGVVLGGPSETFFSIKQNGVVLLGSNPETINNKDMTRYEIRVKRVDLNFIVLIRVWDSAYNIWKPTYTSNTFSIATDMSIWFKAHYNSTPNIRLREFSIEEFFDETFN